MNDVKSNDLFSENEKMKMLENWFQLRADMTSKAFKLILFPSIPIPVFAILFWFQFYIPVPPIILLVILGVSVLFWFVCFVFAIKKLKRVRIGDTIMLKKIKTSRVVKDD